MELVSLADFNTRPYRLKNLEESQDFTQFLENEEKKLLIDLLGYALYKEMCEDLDGSNPSGAFINLRDGAEYTYSGTLFKYNGLKDLLVPAIYSRWIDKIYYVLTASGFKQSVPSQENFQIIDDPEPFIVTAWNDYVSKVGGCYNQENTFYGFMTANKDDYPNWRFTIPQYKNRFGL